VKDDDIFTVMEGLTVPTHISLIFPVDKAHTLMTRSNQRNYLGVPVLDMTQIRVEIYLAPEP
jgi:hypothetical protein